MLIIIYYYYYIFKGKIVKLVSIFSIPSSIPNTQKGRKLSFLLFSIHQTKHIGRKRGFLPLGMESPFLPSFFPSSFPSSLPAYYNLESQQQKIKNKKMVLSESAESALASGILYQCQVHALRLTFLNVFDWLYPSL